MAPEGSAGGLRFSLVDDPEVPRQLFAPATHPYFTDLRKRFNLHPAVEGRTTELEKIRALCSWVHGRWKHGNEDEPTRGDAVTILEEAAQGKRFRCVQYAVTLSEVLAAFGVWARVVALLTEDVETRAEGAGHVVSEAWLSSRRKWVMADAQEDAVVTRNGIPLSALEVSHYGMDPETTVEIPGGSNDTGREYLGAYLPHMFYFQTRVDQRPVTTRSQKGVIVLVPLGAREPQVFQGIAPFKDAIYTRSASAFYRSPQ